jgi:signal transduction histidine kinase
MIINANAAMPDGGELRVASRLDEGENSIIVTIEDTGIGIPPQNLERIFEAFFTTKEGENSVGLGLSICYALIEQHQGKINVASEVGKGTIFNIQLPVIASTKDETGEFTSR